MIPSQDAIISNTEADFNNDDKTDYVVSHGPIVDNKGTQLELITLVDGHLDTFSDPVGLQFRIEDSNSDGSDDLSVWLGNPAVWRKFVWSGDAWVEIDY